MPPTTVSQERAVLLQRLELLDANIGRDVADHLKAVFVEHQEKGVYRVGFDDLLEGIRQRNPDYHANDLERGLHVMEQRLLVHRYTGGAQRYRYAIDVPFIRKTLSLFARTR